MRGASFVIKLDTGWKLGYNWRVAHADVAELVDALASGASVRKYVKVQVLSSAPIFDNFFYHKKITHAQGDF